MQTPRETMKPQTICTTKTLKSGCVVRKLHNLQTGAIHVKVMKQSTDDPRIYLPVNSCGLK